ncbi:hypothetical protein P2G42_13510 [Klebsiella electrica]|uniref:hypothetical protein n=1 Tax=Klebsiella electrica TaxID=1259973 RepID=UPI002553AE15|nr:hypothetical protein [Klebsiella electrica]WIO40989.1 hypothetical protein P2G42_13510 [Klebsiella electrica]
MRLVKYWHVKLFQLSHVPPLAALSGGAPGGSVFSGSQIKRLLAEGYSLVEPQRLSRREEFISLFTSPNPDNREFCQFRIEDIHSMLATPVYEEDRFEQENDCHCLLTAGLDSQNDRVSGIIVGCRDVDKNIDGDKYPSTVSMALYIAQAIFDGYQSQEIGASLDSISRLPVGSLRMEYLHCWKWRHMHEDNDEDIEKVK